MKTTTFAIAAISALQLASAQPFRGRRHAHLHEKKDVVTVVDTVYTQAPEVIVYVDQNGVPYSTGTEQGASTPQTSAAAAPASTASVSSAAQPSSVAVQNAVVAESSSSSAAYVAPSSSTPIATSSAAAPSSSSSSSKGSGFGLSYSPYNDDGTCKSQAQVTADFEKIGDGYSQVRTYGVDCNQVATVLTAIKEKAPRTKLFAGIYDINSLSTAVATIVSAANGDWSSFDTISVGNELVNSGTASASQVVAAINTARGLLKTAGYTGYIVTVDTLVAARANPSLCDNSDYCAVNCHPFYDGGYTADQSGSFLTTQIPTLQAVLANKSQRVVITETGWPWKGQTNDKAVPSQANQAAALSSIKTAFTSNPNSVILFTAFNDMWKTNTAAQFQAEQYWGFL